jgi:hypothetical protein
MTKFIVIIQPTVKKGNKMTKDVKAIKKLEREFKKFNAESVYFYEFNGNKTFEMMIDIPEGSRMAEIVEPMFNAFKARITFQNVYTLNDLKKEVAKKKKKSRSKSS